MAMEDEAVNDEEVDSSEHRLLGMDGPAREAKKPLQRQTIRSHALLVVILAVSAIFGWLSYASFTYHDPANASLCQMAWMSPGYIRMDGLDRSHSRVAGKYALWLYREQGWDISSKPHGVPVLFAPGNAGSYRQVRSLAAAAARQYYESPGQPRQELHDAGLRELDFFAADFNEDFSAFHAATLSEQAEYLADCARYILTLYEQDGSSPSPSAVFVVAHSMGGIAARYMLLQPNFQAGSVKTILTLSTPHAIPPATFDSSIEKIYSDINRYWREAYEKDATGTAEMKDVLLVSIAGGTADTTVSSDYSGVSLSTPPSNGFSVLTTTIPTLLSPVDHLAMMWCDQLRQAVVSAMLRCTSIGKASRAKPLAERLAIMREHLLSLSEKSQPLQPELLGYPFESNKEIRWTSGSTMSEAAIISGDYGLDCNGTGKSLRIAGSAEPSSVEVLLCQRRASECQLLPSSAFRLLPQRSNGALDSPIPPTIWEAVYNGEDLYRSLVVRTSQQAKGMIVASTINDLSRAQTIPLGRMALLGFATRVAPGSASVDLNMSGLATSLLAFRLSARHEQCTPAFSPRLRAYTTDMHESHFYADTTDISIHMHAAPPFLVTDPSHKDLHLQFWRDPTCELHVQLKIDWFTSLGKLVLRYRSIVAAWPPMVLLFILHRQILGDATTPFDAALRIFASCDLVKLVLVSVVIAALQSIWLSITPHSPNVKAALLGNDDIIFIGLAPMFLVCILALVYLVHVVISSSVACLSVLWGLSWKYIPRAMCRDFRFHSTGLTTSRNRIFAIALLLAIVVLFAPHQFAFLVILLVQYDTTVRSHIAAKQALTPLSRERYNQNYTILLALIFLLPQNGAILLIWLRNLQAGWLAPFASDHNIFAISGFLLVAEYLQSGVTPAKLQHTYFRWTTSLAFYLSAGYMLLYGARYTYVVSTSTNMCFVWTYCIQLLSQRIRA